MTENQDGSVTVALQRGVDRDGARVTKMRMREPTARENREAEERSCSDAIKEVDLIAKLAGLPPETIRRMLPKDYRRLQAAFTFLNQRESKDRIWDDHITRLDDGTLLIALRTGFEQDGARTMKVSMREATVEDQLAAHTPGSGALARNIRLCAHLCEVPPEALETVTMTDFNRLCVAADDFF